MTDVTDKMKEDINAAYRDFDKRIDDMYDEMIWELSIKHGISEEQVNQVLDNSRET